MAHNQFPVFKQVSPRCHAALRLRRVAGFVIDIRALWVIRSVQRGEGQVANPFTISMLSLK